MKNSLFIALLLVLVVRCSPSTKLTDDTHEFTNALIHESSPYLLQHAHNPVNWHPWNAETLAKAKAANKMLIISVGYSACHWCHVMEHESFEDTTVARIMNTYFIPIKIDREERPDVDDVYMTACHLASKRSCGWPLNAFALPDGRPAWAGTYFPKEEWLNVLNQFTHLQQNDPQKLEQYAQQLTQGIRQSDAIVTNNTPQNFRADWLETVSTRFLQMVDLKKGGRTGAPKFPMPNNYQYLLKYYAQTGEPAALKAVETTLDNMAWGGIYDHLGGGFARYSTDANWHVPHFEKMLYDNGQLISLYSEAYQLTQNPLYKQVVEESLVFIARELTAPDGGFYSSLDADSEGVEGKFYVWSKEEIEATLADERTAKIFNEYYEVRASGNWEHTNILYRKQSATKVAEKYKLTETELQTLLQTAKTKLLAVRAKRIRPGLDDKVLTAWNALMISGYVDAYKAFGNSNYLEAALKNADFLRQNMFQKGNQLYRNHKDGKSVINAFLDDYALTIQAFTKLYEVTFDEQYLLQAKALMDYSITHFYDPNTGLFNYTSKLDPPLIARKKETGDNVIPGSNSVMARNLHSLSLYFYEQDYATKSRQMLHNLTPSIENTQSPSFFSNWLQLYLDFVQAPYEIAILGKQSAQQRDKLLRHYLPNAIVLGGKTEGTLGLLKNKLQPDKTLIYVCQNKVCKFPVETVDAALGLLK